MAFVLPVWRGLSSIAIPVNASNRVDVYDAADAANEIVNSPDTTPALGGKFPVYDASDALYTISYQNNAGGGSTIEDFITLTPGPAIQGGWLR